MLPRKHLASRQEQLAPAVSLPLLFPCPLKSPVIPYLALLLPFFFLPPPCPKCILHPHAPANTNRPPSFVHGFTSRSLELHELQGGVNSKCCEWSMECYENINLLSMFACVSDLFSTSIEYILTRVFI